MEATESITLEELARDLGKTVPEVLEAAKNFTTAPGALFSKVPPKVEKRIRVYFDG